MITLPFSSLPRQLSPDCDALNLRPRSDGSTEVVAPPAILSSSGWRPLDGIWFANGSCIGLLSADNTVTTVATLPSNVTAVRPVTPDSVLIFTAAHGSRTLTRDASGWSLSPASPSLPAIELRASASVSLSASIGPRTLSADYSRQARLAPADLDAIRSDLRTAYDSLGAQAATLGLCIQPILARWRLIDAASGHSVCSSPQLLIAPPGGFQGASLIDVDASVTDKGFTRLDSYSLTIEAFSIEVIASDDAISANGLRLEVEVSPPVDPVDFTRPPVYRLNPRVTSGPLISLALPATDSAHLFASSVIPAICEHWESLAQPWPPSLLSSDAASSARSSLLKLLSAVPAASRVPPELLPPHTFSASGSCMSGNVVVWHGLRPCRFPGYPPPYLVCGGDPDVAPATAAVIVEFADGSRIISQGTVPAGALWNPLLSYPDGTARRLVIVLSEGDEVRRLALPLTPSSCGRMAFWLHPSCEPFSVVDHPLSVTVPWQLPPQVDAAPVDSELCGCASADSPLSLTDVSPVSAGAVVAVEPSPGSGSAWDFATPKFIAFCSDGIHALALSMTDAGPEFKGARLLDHRAVTSAAAVCRAPDGVYALAASHLVKVGRTGVTDVLPSLTPEGVMGYSAGSLWISTPSWLGCLNVASRCLVRRSLGADESPGFLSITPAPGGGLFALTPGGQIADLSVCSDSPTSLYAVPMTFTRVVEIGALPVAVLLHLVVPALSSTDPATGLPVVSACSLRLVVSLAAAPGAAPLLDVAISGVVATPIVFPIFSPPVTRLKVSLSGTAPAGTILHSISFKVHSYERHLSSR